MYTYIEIKDNLSSATAKLLSDADIFANFVKAAESIINSILGNTTKTDATLQPFIWIIEYLASIRLSGLSETTMAYNKDNYELAKTLLIEQNTTAKLGSKLGTIDVPYSNEG